MKINCLDKNFSDEIILYAPELELPGTGTIEEKCYPAAGFVKNDPSINRFFYLDIASIGEYAEIHSHHRKSQAWNALGGREKLESKFTAMYEKMFKIYNGELGKS